MGGKESNDGFRPGVRYGLCTSMETFQVLIIFSLLGFCEISRLIMHYTAYSSALKSSADRTTINVRLKPSSGTVYRCAAFSRNSCASKNPQQS